MWMAGGPGLAVLSAHAITVPENCFTRNDWVCPLYFTRFTPQLLAATGQHLYLAATSLVIGVLLAVPIGVFAHRVRRARGLTLGLTTVIYTIPSIALFLLLLPVFGISAWTVIAGLALYSLVVVVRAVVSGLDAVDAGVRDAAAGMGLGPWRVLWRVEAPLALPAVMAGLRVAAVSTIALTTVGEVIGFGGLGNLVFQGLQSNFRMQVLTASVGCVLLAVLADLVLLLLARLVTPWRRGSAA